MSVLHSVRKALGQGRFALNPDLSGNGWLVQLLKPLDDLIQVSKIGVNAEMVFCSHKLIRNITKNENVE